MNADRFLAYYEKVADAPDAVERLRQFILSLAVRGKLVPQLAKERSASNFDAELPIDIETSFEIPQNWRWSRLRKLGKLVGGGTPSKLRDDFWDGNIPWVSPKDMKVDYINKSQMNISNDAIAGSAANLIDIGSMLFVVRGMILAHSFPVAISGAPLTINQDMKALSLKEPEMGEFLLRALKGLKPEMLKRVQRSSHGTCRLDSTDYGDFLLPLPPLAEQHRIVAKVDELMGLCDRLEAARADRETVRDRLAAASLARLNVSETTVPAAATSPAPETSHAFADHARFVLDALPALTARPDQIRGLRQTILSLAVRGKLVPQNAKDEPALGLLDRIAKDKAARAVSARDRRAAKIRPLLDTEAPFPLPATWLWASLGDITISRDSERIPVSREERTQKSKIYDYYGASGIIDKIDGYIFDKPLLLIGEDGANLINRSTPIAFIARGKYWVNNHAHVLDGLSESFLQYIDLFINAIDLKPYVTGTAQPKMNQAKMNIIPVALPPLAEQTRIVAKVDALMALCDNLEASLTAAVDTRRRLLDALLAEALAPDEDRLLEAAE